ncbi:hypothetical protein AQUCO_01000596v1 [Aquilegia coerulea]|uniref:Tyrosine specific protein phosphatases domain-containing protein n=1 Tax=Aquilegia coerulea TaxID=218851 RepID=A0A2G5EB80_AQUCA|nr:hypothetical protein AQUCO_01000596v1 [Aquilegia coerulea]
MEMESQQEELLLLCEVCEHNHKYEVCGVCGHSPTHYHITKLDSVEGAYRCLGRSEMCRIFSTGELTLTITITIIIYETVTVFRRYNHLDMFCVFDCVNINARHFTCHSLQEKKVLQFDDAIHFLDQCEEKQARVLVHCMTGNSRSAAIVIAYLMKFKGWRLEQSYQWVKERRPPVDLSPGL